MSNFNAAGVPIVGHHMAPTGVYVIVVQQPAAAPAFDWQAPQTRPRRNDGNLRRLTIALGVLMIVVCIAWAAWSILAANGVQLPRLPWQPNGEPVVTRTEPQGWTLPNPFQPAQDAADAVSNAVAMLGRLLLVAGALFGLWLLRGLLGPLARGAADLVRGMVRR